MPIVPLQISHIYHVIDEPGFAIGYGEWLRNPLWVSWRVHGGKLNPLSKRPRHFVCAETLTRVCADDFSRSGFDRGHLAPNYAMSRLYGRQAQQASFSMANIAPQRHAMNARAWQRLEELEMDRLRPRGGQSMYVMAGPVFAKPPVQRLNSGVAIPTAFWRLWVRWSGTDYRDAEAIAFVVPQQATGREDLRRFVATVDEVESQAGMNLLSRLPDFIEAAIESQSNPERWLRLGDWTRPSRY